MDRHQKLICPSSISPESRMPYAFPHVDEKIAPVNLFLNYMTNQKYFFKPSVWHLHYVSRPGKMSESLLFHYIQKLY